MIVLAGSVAAHVRRWLRVSTGCNLHELMCLAVQCLHGTQSVCCSNCNNVLWLRLSTGCLNLRWINVCV